MPPSGPTMSSRRRGRAPAMRGGLQRSQRLIHPRVFHCRRLCRQAAIHLTANMYPCTLPAFQTSASQWDRHRVHPAKTAPKAKHRPRRIGHHSASHNPMAATLSRVWALPGATRHGSSKRRSPSLFASLSSTAKRSIPTRRHRTQIAHRRRMRYDGSEDDTVGSSEDLCRRARRLRYTNRSKELCTRLQLSQPLAQGPSQAMPFCQAFQEADQAESNTPAETPNSPQTAITVAATAAAARYIARVNAQCRWRGT